MTDTFTLTYTDGRLVCDEQIAVLCERCDAARWRAVYPGSTILHPFDEPTGKRFKQIILRTNPLGKPQEERDKVQEWQWLLYARMIPGGYVTFG